MPKRPSRTPHFTTLEKALEIFGTRSSQVPAFICVFHGRVERRCDVPLLFSENQFVIDNKGACSREEMILLVLFRLRLTAEFELLPL